MKYFALVVWLFATDGRDETFTFDRFVSRDDCRAAVAYQMESIIADALTVVETVEAMTGRRFADEIDVTCILEAAI